MKEKKPIYKQWWLWVIVLIVFFAIVGNDAEEPKEVAELTEKAELEEPIETIEEEPSKEAENEETIIELNRKITSADYTVIIQRAKIDEGKLIIVFDWENQSDWDPAHFELLGSITVEQDGEYLEELSGDRKYKQIKRNMFDVYDLEYKLINESDITVRITAAAEYDDSQDEFIIEYE